jgi:TetR/AcrR family transcriptional regulator
MHPTSAQPILQDYQNGADAYRRVPAKARRAQILQVARSAFAAKGFRGTTTKEIAAAAGVTEALVFQHFATKQDLYNSILEGKVSEYPIEAALAVLRAHAERRDDRAFLEEYARCTLGRYSTDSEFLRLMLYSALEGHESAQTFRLQQVQPLRVELRKYIALRQQEGAFRKSSVAAAVRAFAGMITHYAIVKALFGAAEAELSEKRAIREFTNLFLQGVAERPVQAGDAQTA